jgi:hypothetical protein
MFQHDQSTSPPIDDPTVRVAPSPQVATGSSSDSQPIQNQGIGEKAKDLAVTIPMIQTHAPKITVSSAINGSQSTIGRGERPASTIGWGQGQCS